MVKKRDKLLFLGKTLSKEIHDVQVSADKTRQDAYEVARSAAASPSQSGDRFHATAQADIVQKRLDDINTTLVEIKKATDEKIPTKITKTCYVELLINDNTLHRIFILKNLVSLPIEEKIVSADSLLGKAIVGKKAGQNFEYDPSGTGVKVKGVVNTIE